ncbi:replication initiator protein RctB domain-containing protein [Psychromonas aquimarina]|uniref:replication initiator protein RctB domain-containing protein n=1 Tax=Psychromonas aquimarina TaxID=444919 RepID=UPI00040755A9|nr:replication initiator protein RctB domain-containing protein [Psychromonas aquimarina]
MINYDIKTNVYTLTHNNVTGGLIQLSKNSNISHPLSSKKLQQINIIRSIANEQDNYFFTFKEISEALDLTLPSVRRWISELFSKSNFFKKIPNVVNAPNQFSFYIENDYEKTHSLSPAKNIPAQFSRCKSDQVVAFSDPININDEALLSVPETAITHSLLSIPPTYREQNPFDLIDILPPTGTKTKKFDGGIFKGGDNLLSFRVSNNLCNVITLEDVKFIYAIIALTIRYQSNVHQNSNFLIKGFDWSVPIFRDDIARVIGKKVGQAPTTDFIDNKMLQIENTQFALTSLNFINENLNFADFKLRNKTKLFEISGYNAYVKNGKEAKPYVYHIKWAPEIFKDIFKQKVFFILPAKVFVSHDLVWQLYLYVRKHQNHNPNIELKNENLVNLLGLSYQIEVDGKLKNTNKISLYRSIMNKFKKSKDSEFKEIKRTNRTNLQQVCKIDFKGIHFTLKLTTYTNKSSELIFISKSNKLESLRSAHPQSKQQFIQFDNEGNLKDVTKQYLKKNQMGSKSAVKINSLTHLSDRMSQQINDEKSEMEKILFSSEDDLPLSEIEDLKINSPQQVNQVNINAVMGKLSHAIRHRFDSRSFGWRFSMSDKSYAATISIYLEKQDLVSIADKIAKATKKDPISVREKIEKYHEKTKLLKLKGHMQYELTIQNFKTIKKIIISSGITHFSNHDLFEQILGFKRSIEKDGTITKNNICEELSARILKAN